MERTADQNPLLEIYEKHINPAYPPFLRQLGLSGVAMKAEGDTITDTDGRTFVDCVGGYGLFNIGHNHPKVAEALTAQLNKKQLLTRPLITDESVGLAEALAEITPEDLNCSFVCNSGSEAIDTAIKLARLNTGRKKIITLDKAFHGYTFGALSASGIRSFKRLFEPLVPEIVQIEFGDLEGLRNNAGKDTAAIILELVQHEAGVRKLPQSFVDEARELCHQQGILLVIDEIKTGCGRTGRMFACEHYNVVPDVLVLGKSLGGGFIPIGAVLARTRLWKKFSMSFPMSASSFAWNTLACTAAKTALEIIRAERLIEGALNKGNHLQRELTACVERFPNILKKADGLGLLIGVVTNGKRITLDLCKHMAEQGVLALPAFGDGSVLMIEPPLVISESNLEIIIHAFRNACERLNVSPK
jgi:putrescine aminotransferase